MERQLEAQKLENNLSPFTIWWNGRRFANVVIFTCIYSLMHAYLFARAKAAIAFSHRLDAPIAAVLVLMILSPILVRTFDKIRYQVGAKVMAWIGYSWLAFIFLFVSIGSVIDIYHALALYVGGFAIPSTSFSFYVPLCGSFLICIYGYLEARDIRIERHVIRTSKIPQKKGSLKIVQISDVHLGPMTAKSRLSRIVHLIQRESPDLVVSTGDLVDGETDGFVGMDTLLAQIRPPFGKFAVTGNHEFYVDIEDAINFTIDSGFEMLRGGARTVNGILNIAGVDDPTALTADRTMSVSEQEVLSHLDPSRFTVLLKHRPYIDAASLGLYDLQLSGHTHKGQIFPFNLLTGIAYKTDAGFLSLPGGSLMYVSRGTGTWGPPIRFLAKPEITVIELVYDAK